MAGSPGSKWIKSQKMYNYTNYPTVDVSYMVKSDLNVTPSQLSSGEESTSSTLSLSDLMNSQRLYCSVIRKCWRCSRSLARPPSTSSGRIAGFQIRLR